MFKNELIDSIRKPYATYHGPMKRRSGVQNHIQHRECDRFRDTLTVWVTEAYTDLKSEVVVLKLSDLQDNPKGHDLLAMIYIQLSDGLNAYVETLKAMGCKL